MKIIKHGKCVRLFRGTCESCGCVVEADRTEIDYQKSDGDMPYRIVCPECTTLIGMDEVFSN